MAPAGMPAWFTHITSTRNETQGIADASVDVNIASQLTDNENKQHPGHEGHYCGNGAVEASAAAPKTSGHSLEVNPSSRRNTARAFSR